jgi:hypothetical protein
MLLAEVNGLVGARMLKFPDLGGSENWLEPLDKPGHSILVVAVIVADDVDRILQALLEELRTFTEDHRVVLRLVLTAAVIEEVMNAESRE